MEGANFAALRTAAEDFAKETMSAYDASHDFSHVDRVRKLALTIGGQEGLGEESLQTIELAALLHDRVLEIIAKMGFKEELDGSADRKKLWPIEIKVVQDADRIDAIGAIGIARCLTFGGKFDRVLYDPKVKPRASLSKDVYASSGSKQTTINHFHEKLFLLKDMMNTESGRRIAQGRHEVMQQWLDRFLDEWDGRC